MKIHSCQEKQKRFSWKYLLLLLVLFIAPATTFAYSGTTHPGRGASYNSGNVYTVDYLYDSAHNCIYTHFHSTRGGVGAFDWGNQKDFGPYRTSGNLPFETSNIHVGKGHSLKDAVAAGAANGWDWNRPSLQNFLRKYTQNRFGAYYANGTTYDYLTGITTEEGGAVHPLPPVPATCTTGGYTPYSDGTRGNETNALGHQPSRWMDRSDGAYHYRICTRPTNQGGCNHKSENNPLQTGQHEYGPWVSDNAYTHHRNCKDCGHKETDNHHFTEWKDDPNKPGWQERHCKDCGHKEWRDVEPPTVSISAAPIGTWQRGDVTVTVKAKDRGSGLKLVSLYRKDVLTGEVACIKNFNFSGETSEQTKTYTETAEGRWLYYAKAADQWSNSKTTDWTGKEAMLDHSNPVQIVTLGGNSTRTVTKHGTKKVYVPGEQKTVTETKQVPKVPVYEDSTTAMQGKNVKVYYNNITYQLDGGSSKDPLPSEYICGKGVKVPNVTKSGYAFMGWTVTCEGKTYSNSPMKDLTIGTKSTGDITLKANWSGTYDIFFTSIPETTQGSMQKTGMMKFGQTYTLPKNQFSLTGYSFSGWNTDFDGNGDHYADQAKVKDLCKTAGGNVILYAEWTPHTYNVAFSPNGGTGNTAGQSFTYDEAKALIANGFSRKGYTFIGWNTKADGSGTAYSDKQSVENLTATDKATVTLYAQWKPITYTVKIHLNGGKITDGTWGSAGNDTFTKTYTIESSDWNLPTPAKDHYDWNGWTGTDKGNTVTIPKGSTGDKEYSANWTPHNYTITYNLNGGTISDQPKEHVYGTENKIPRPTRDGYTFAGWTVNGGSDRYADVTISANYHENVSLSASWTQYLSGTHTVHHPYIKDWVWVAEAYAAIAGHPEWMQQWTTKTWTTGGAHIGDPCIVAEKAYRNDEANIIPDTQYPYQWANGTLANWFASTYGWTKTTKNDPAGRFTANKYYPVFQGAGHDFGYDSDESYNYWSPYEPSNRSITIN
ncbi:InlB B-repeat-containing protein [Lachnospiraceae bacterium YH-ros2226]